MDASMRSGGVLKKKGSSGCLVIKAKVESKNFVASGFFNNSQHRKRPRLTVCYSSSSDEDESLEHLRRKVIEKRNNNGSMGCKKKLAGREYNRSHDGMIKSVEKNSLNLFEFDEYDEFDGEKMKNNHLTKRFQMVEQGNSQKFGVGPSERNSVADERKKGMHLDHSSSGKRKTLKGGIKGRGLESEDEEIQMHISSSKLKDQKFANEPIRLQGRNGVLKVLVNKKKKADLPSLHRNSDRTRGESGDHIEGPSSKNAFKKDTVMRSPVFSDPKPSKNRGSLVGNEKSDKNKKERNSGKVMPFLTNNSEAGGFLANDSDTTLKLSPPGSQAQTFKKREKEKEISPPSPVNKIPMKGKERKIEKSKPNGSTEKQMLREKIRKMLIDSGWTIDYRPRRNRDYLDAVYINPSGTAYWSIIKAYDAFQKKQEEDSFKNKLDVDSPSFAPLSEDLLNKLTRQTKKKIKEEMKWKRKLDTGSEDLSDESPKRKPKKELVKNSYSNIIQGRTSKVIGRCTLLARGSDNGESSYSDGYVPYNGKRTVLSWLIDSGTAKLSEKVQYMNRRRNRVMLEGWITRDGIHCGCCSKILTLSKFELHAGSKLRQPFQNICLESGDSLLQCQIEAWNKQEESMRQDFHNVDIDSGDPDDDTCGICGDGGDLVCCDRCPSTFHQVCLDIKMLSSGDWHCPNCTCRYCGDAITIDSDDVSDSEEPIKCVCCDKKYHKSCRKGEFAASSNSNNASVCGKKCREIYDHLQKILGVKHELEAGHSWSLIRRKDVSDTSNRNFSQRVECNSKLAVALSVMNECFLPIFDRRSGINLMHSVVYNCGSNFNRLNYSGFYTAILEHGDEIISAASIRIHGMHLAEMPFIGTRETYRRRGMCSRLLSAIETALASMGVEKLIIPAISEHTNTWTSVFSFHQLEDNHKKEIKSMNMLVFPGTDMLQKQLAKQEICADFEPKKNKLQQHDSENPASDASLVHTNCVENDPEACAETMIDENVCTLNSDSSAMTGHSNAVVEPTASDALCESASKAITVDMSETTKEQKGFSSGLVGTSGNCEGNYSSDSENPLLHLVGKEKNCHLMETIMSNVSEFNPEDSYGEAVRDSSDEPPKIAKSVVDRNPLTSESTEVGKIQVSLNPTLKVSTYAAAPELESVNDCAKSMVASPLETLTRNATDEVNGEESCSVTFTMKVVTEEPLVQLNLDMGQPTVSVAESELNSCEESSNECKVDATLKETLAIDIAVRLKFIDADDNKGGISACYTRENAKVSCEQFVSAEEINENQLQGSSLLKIGESAMKDDTVIDSKVYVVRKEIDVRTETDSHPLASPEDAQGASDNENQPKQNTC